MENSPEARPIARPAKQARGKSRLTFNPAGAGPLCRRGRFCAAHGVNYAAGGEIESARLRPEWNLNNSPAGAARLFGAFSAGAGAQLFINKDKLAVRGGGTSVSGNWWLLGGPLTPAFS